MRASPIRRILLVLSTVAFTAMHHGSAAEPSAAGGEPLRRPTLVLLTPGTKVPGDRPLPQNWTHLIIKSMPRLASGDLGSLPSIAQSTATLFRATLLAEVRRAGGLDTPFELRRVGIGLCMPVNGVDTVVSSATVNQVHAGLGFVGRRVLEEAEQELMRGRVKARTPTFVLYSAPSTRKAGRSHEAVLLRYALLVDPHTGTLQTILWAQAREPRLRTAPDQLSILPPGLLFDAALDVAAGRVLNTVPVTWSFAMIDLPSGKKLAPTPGVREWTLRDTLSPSEAAAFETELRRTVAAASEKP
ncbi:MAG: hypothetical protein P4L84_23510 [Isosphaeraceae bacterium]|nr:hypothetical protein [Isosphaeraceae bacterium]